MVADGGKPPIDKGCGEALMPDAIAALKKLGVALPAADFYSLRGVRFLSSGLSAEAVFPSDSYGLSLAGPRCIASWWNVRPQWGGRSAVAECSYGGIWDEFEWGMEQPEASWIIGADALARCPVGGS